MLRSITRSRLGYIIGAVTTGALAARSEAQSQKNYQGPSGGEFNKWSIAANWDAGVEPNDTHHVVIPYAATTVMDLPYTSDFGTKILSLSVAGGGTVDLEL